MESSFCYTQDEEYKYYDPYQMYQDGKAEALAVLENSYLYHKVPLNDRQVLCFSFPLAESTSQVASLLLVTAPETAQ